MDSANTGNILPALVRDAVTLATLTAFEELTQTLVNPVPADPNEHSSHDWAFSVARHPGEAGTLNDFVALIILRRPVPGRFVLLMPRSTMETLGKRYLPSDTTLDIDLLADTAGEFANVIAGQAKTVLKATPYHFAMSPPIVQRPGADTPLLDLEPEDVFTFSCDAGTFYIRLHLPHCPNA